MTAEPGTTWNRDVFICFSKARPGEARVALAIKDALERLGLAAFEYEDWSWVAAHGTGAETDVDRHTLLTLLDAATVIVLITPHEGEASAGVQVELDALRDSRRATIAVTWSPSGWSEVLEPERFERLNLIWSMEGVSTARGDVDDRQCAHIGRAVARASWLAHQLQVLSRHHPGTAGALFNIIPEGPYRPLENLRLVRPETERTSWDDDWPDASALRRLAQRVVDSASPDELGAFQLLWRDGRGVVARELASSARGPLSRTLRLFHDACMALLDLAVQRCGEQDSVDAMIDRSLMLTRFGHDDEALATLAAALEGADPAQRVRLHQARAFILQEDLAASLDAVDAALAHASDDETRCLLRYQRGTLHLRAAQLPLALDDFTFAAEHSQIASTSQSALLARALAHARAGDDDDAAADCGRIIARESETPRLAVMARQERGRIYADRGRYEDALADWAAGLAMADAADEQRFRILERRQALFERLGDTARAASDAEALASYRSVSAAYRSELRDSAATLRTRR